VPIWKTEQRVITQDQGDWQVDYRLRLTTQNEVHLKPNEITAIVDGWVSNSRVPVHAIPKRSTPKVAGTGTSTFEVIVSNEETKKCRERIVIRAWPALAPEPANRPKTTPANVVDPLFSVSIAPQGILCIRIRLEHEHFLYGSYDPLLGVRHLELTLGSSTLHDSIPIEREQYLTQSKEAWSVPPEDRRDTTHFVSAPDSLHLEAHVPGNHYYHFSDRPVRYNTKMKLSFWYLIAPGTEGEFRSRMVQYKDNPSGWHESHQNAVEETYTTVGRWTKVERIFRTEGQTTSLALDFKLYGAEDVGEVWIDDVKLEPLCSGSSKP
jgi:hypothetical protein